MSDLVERLRGEPDFIPWPERLLNEAADALDLWQSNSRDKFDAMCAMRDSINEHLPMPSLESDLLQGPETSVFCAAVASAVIAELSRLSALVAWQDIETAPKDGTRILIEFVHANAKFSPDPVGEGWIAVHEAYWLDHNAGGWTWYGLSGVATRWLPLPAPPVSQLKDTTNADK